MKRTCNIVVYRYYENISKTYEKLNKDIHCYPNKNYNILESEIIKSMESNMDKKTVKLYKCLKQTKSDSTILEERKQRFNRYKNTLRKTITQTKKLYYSNQFARHVGNGQKTWQTIMTMTMTMTMK